MIQAMFGAAIAGDERNIGLISVEEMKLVYDQYTDDEQAGMTEQACYHCGGVRLRSEMYGSLDGRVFCGNCAARRHQLEDLRFCSIARRVREALAKMCGYGLENLDIEKMMAKLGESIYDDKSYKDGYSGDVQNGRQFYIDGLRPQGGIRHHDRVSIEKPFPVYLASGEVVLHHPDNAILTRDIFNLVKGTYFPVLLPWIL